MIKGIIPKSVIKKSYHIRKILWTPKKDLLIGYPKYIFHHLPKTGGTSIYNALSRWFSMVPDYAPEFQSKDFPKYAINKVDVFRLKPYECLAGHYTKKHFINERYPEILDNPKFRIISFLRDPLEIMISLYYYRKKHHKKISDSLEEHLLNNQSTLSTFFPCTKENYKNVLDSYFFIGILEYGQESMDLLAKKIYRPKTTLPVVNSTQRDTEVSEIAKTIFKEFKRINELDYLIYDYCKQKLNFQ